MGPIRRSSRAGRCGRPWPRSGDRAVVRAHRLRGTRLVRRRRDRPVHRRPGVAGRFTDIAPGVDHPSDHRRRGRVPRGALAVQRRSRTARCGLGRGDRPAGRCGSAVARANPGRCATAAACCHGAGGYRRWLDQRSVEFVDRSTTRTTAPPAVGAGTVDDRRGNRGRHLGVAVQRECRQSRRLGLRMGDCHLGRRSAGRHVRRPGAVVGESAGPGEAQGLDEAVGRMQAEGGVAGFVDIVARLLGATFGGPATIVSAATSIASQAASASAPAEGRASASPFQGPFPGPFPGPT